MLPLRSAAGLLSDGRLLPEPLPGGAAAPRGGRGPAGVRRGPADRHPGAEEPDDEAHFRRPLRRQGGPPAPHPHTHKGGGIHCHQIMMMMLRLNLIWAKIIFCMLGLHFGTGCLVHSSQSETLAVLKRLGNNGLDANLRHVLIIVVMFVTCM